VGRARASRRVDRCHARGGQAVALNDIGRHLAELGELRQALDHCRRAPALVQATGDLSGRTHTWKRLGHIHRHLGRNATVVECNDRAFALFPVPLSTPGGAPWTCATDSTAPLGALERSRRRVARSGHRSSARSGVLSLPDRRSSYSLPAFPALWPAHRVTGG